MLFLKQKNSKFLGDVDFCCQNCKHLKKTKSDLLSAYPLVRKSVTSHRKFSQPVTVGGKFRYARPDYNPITPHPSPRFIHLVVKMFIIFPSWVMVRVVPRCLFWRFMFPDFFFHFSAPNFSLSLLELLFFRPLLSPPLSQGRSTMVREIWGSWSHEVREIAPHLFVGVCVWRKTDIPYTSFPGRILIGFRNHTRECRDGSWPYFWPRLLLEDCRSNR